MNRTISWATAVAVMAALVSIDSTQVAMAAPDRGPRSITVQEGSQPRTLAKLPLSARQAASIRKGRKLRARLRVSTTTPRVGAQVTFRTQGSRAKRGLRVINLRYGDGHRTKGRKLAIVRKHRYTRAGTYRARLTVVDRQGKKARVTRSIVVVPRSPKKGTGAQSPRAQDKRVISPDTAPGAVGDGAPASADLRGWAMPVKSQGQINSCVSWTTAYAMLGWYHRRTTGKATTFAPMYIYRQTYLGLNAQGMPKGSYATTALGKLQSEGVDTAAHFGAGWDYEWRGGITASQRANAAQYRIRGHGLLFSHPDTSGANTSEIEAMKTMISQGRPLAIAFRVRTNFQNYRGGWYRGAGDVLGLHEMLALGYNSNGLFIQNSWGKDHGVDGYTFMTWDTVRRDLYEAAYMDGIQTAATGDTTKPVMNTFTRKFGAGYEASNGQAPMTFTWSGSDNQGVTQYVLYYRANGGEWGQLAIGNQQKQATYNLQFGVSYEFAVAAYDAAGNMSNWSLSGSFTPSNYQESVASYTGTWTDFDSTQYMNGRSRVSAQQNAQMKVRVTGKNFGLVGTRWSGGGVFDVYLDGQFQFTIDQYSASTRYRSVLFWFNFSQDRQYEITLVVRGTAGRPNVDVDSFLVT